MTISAKKLSLLIALMISMVGSGGCITMAIVSEVADSIEESNYHARNLKAYQQLLDKIKTNQASASDYLLFAYINHDHRAMEKIDSTLTEAQIQQNYEYYLNKAAQAGNNQAKLELAQLPLIKTVNIWRATDDASSDPHHTDRLLTQYAKLSQEQPELFCQLLPLESNRGIMVRDLKPAITFIHFNDLISRHYSYGQLADLQNFHAIILAWKIQCHPELDKDISLENFINRYSNSTPSTKITPLNEANLNKAVYYMAFAKLTNQPELTTQLWNIIPADQQKTAEERVTTLMATYQRSFSTRI